MRIYSQKRRVRPIFLARMGVLAVGVLGVLFLGYLLVRGFGTQSPSAARVVDNAYMEKENTAYRLVGTDPESLQRLFDQDIEDGMNDERTKSHVYFIMNRYFNNGGNIYEIYDYVNSRPKLAFLQEASALYPPVFQMIADRSIAPSASPVALLAYLAYLETLERNGYGGIALRGTGAHQYAQLAYATQEEPDVLDPGINATQNILMKKNKALFFAEQAREDVLPIFEGRADEILARDKVVGLSHYAVTLRYFERLGVDFSSPKTARQIFALCRKMIEENNLPELAPFTGLLDASTLLFDAESSADEVRLALEPILVVDPKSDSGEQRTIQRILASKTRNASMTSELGASLSKVMQAGVYDRTNIIALAQKVPEFKVWLLDAGWTETDFEIEG